MAEEFKFRRKSFGSLTREKKLELLSRFEEIRSPDDRAQDDWRDVLCLCKQKDEELRLFRCSGSNDVKTMQDLLVSGYYHYLVWYLGNSEAVCFIDTTTQNYVVAPLH